MIVLLDTHALIWSDSDPTQLSPQAVVVLQDPANTLFLSIASVWEMQIKFQLGKLALNRPLAEIIKDQQANRIQLLGVRLEHVIALGGLPSPHKDPFDRMLVAQAIVEGATLLSADPIFQQYPVSVIW